MSTIFIYIIIEIFALSFMYLAQKHRINRKAGKGKVKKSTVYLILSFIPLLLLSGLRNISVGVDTRGYIDTFRRIIENRMMPSDERWLGWGYKTICEIVGFLFGNNYVFLNLVISFLTLYFIYKAIWENSQNSTLSLFLFISTTLYYQTFNQARQLLAISIILYSFKYIKTRNFRKYFIFVLFAIAIHTSAVIMLPFYYITNWKISKRNIFVLFAIALFIVFFKFDYLEKIILLSNYGQVYYGTEYYIVSSSSVINLIFRIALLFFTLFFSKIAIKDDESNKYLINFSIFCTLLQILTLKLYILSRLTTYFYIFYILLLPNILESINEKKLKNYMYFLIIVLFSVYHIVYYNYNSVIAGYNVYRFFL